MKTYLVAVECSEFLHNILISRCNVVIALKAKNAIEAGVKAEEKAFEECTEFHPDQTWAYAHKVSKAKEWTHYA